MDVKLFHGSFGVVEVIVDRNAKDNEAFAAVLVVGSHDIRSLLAARTAPGSPEINEGVAAVADKIRKCAG